MDANNSVKIEGSFPIISFLIKDYGDIIKDHDNLIVLIAMTHNWMVKRILVNQGSLVDILYKHAFKALAIPYHQLTPK